MPKLLAAIASAWLLAFAGCAARVETARPQGQPKAPAEAARELPARPADVPKGSGTPAGTARGVGAPAPGPAASPAAKPPAEGAPPATPSAYVFSPQQAVSARPGASPQGSAPVVPPAPSRSAAAPSPPASAPTRPAPSSSPDASGESARSELHLIVAASAPSIATGAVLTVDVMASSNAPVVDAPLHLSFDPAVVEFLDGTPGDFLTQGGSSIVFFADGRSRPGDVAIAAGRVVRGEGASGSGLLCRIRFRGVGPGSTALAVGQAKAWGTGGEELIVATAGTRVVVN